MLLIRKILFYLFAALYLIFCPLTILYALGYLFKPGVEKGIVKTGLIYLYSAPAGASLYMGDKRYTKRTPAILRDLLPGSYPIKLILKGYKTWTQTVPVEAEKATVLEKVLLLPEGLDHEALSAEEFQDLIPLEDGSALLASQGENLEDLYVYNVKEGQLSPILASGSPWSSGKYLSCYSVADSSHILLRADFNDGEKYLWVEFNGKGVKIEDVSPLFRDRPLHVEWDPREKTDLFSLEGNRLRKLDLSAKSVEPAFLSPVRGFGVFDRQIYVLKEEGTFLKMNREGGRGESLLEDPYLGKQIFGEHGFFDVRVLAKNIVIFLGEKGELLASRLPYRFVPEGVRGVAYDAAAGHLLVWQRDKLGVLDFSKAPEADGIFEKGPRLHWIFKQGVDIQQAFWVYDGSHILFRDDDHIYLIALETYGRPHLDMLLRVKRKSSVYYSENLGKLFYLDDTSHRLSSAEVLPRREILSFPFPERKEEKKQSEIQEL